MHLEVKKKREKSMRNQGGTLGGRMWKLGNQVKSGVGEWSVMPNIAKKLDRGLRIHHLIQQICDIKKNTFNEEWGWKPDWKGFKREWEENGNGVWPAL